MMALKVEDAASPDILEPEPAAKMDKLSLNNTVVKLRPIVVQSKVHCIHKLSAAIKGGDNWDLAILSCLKLNLLGGGSQ